METIKGKPIDKNLLLCYYQEFDCQQENLILSVAKIQPLKGKAHIFSDVIKSLHKKRDVKIYEHKKKICLLFNSAKKKKFDLGNKSLGKIDYLVNHCHFHIFYVKSFED